MKKLILIFALLFYAQHFFAQPKIDSLLNALSIRKDDSNKVNALYELSRYYFYTHADSAYLYAQQGQEWGILPKHWKQSSLI
jgi:hypothetical protein